MQRRHIDLCAGTGGFTQACVQSFTAVYANDICPSSKTIYDLNHPSVPLDCRPIDQVKLTDLPVGPVDLITGGFPCQPYSIEGRRAGLQDPRADVFEHIMRIAKHIQPRWIVLENVANLARLEKGLVLQRITDKAQRYLPGWQLKCSLYSTDIHTGIPQGRERLYLVWFRDAKDAERFQFIHPSHVPLRPVRAMLEPTALVPDHYYYSTATNVGRSLITAATESINATNTVYQRRRDHIRTNKSSVVPTLTAGMGTGGNNVPVIRDARGVRKLTPRETFNLQGFQSQYRLPDELTDSQLYKLAGNAISVPVARLIVEALLQLG